MKPEACLLQGTAGRGRGGAGMGYARTKRQVQQRSMEQGDTEASGRAQTIQGLKDQGKELRCHQGTVRIYWKALSGRMSIRFEF